MYKPRQEFLKDILLKSPEGLSREEIYQMIPEYRTRKAGTRTFLSDLARLRAAGYDIPLRNGHPELPYTIKEKIA